MKGFFSWQNKILGANFDDNGELRVWWQPDTRNFFESKKQCFIAQYDSKTNPFIDKKVGFIKYAVPGGGGTRSTYTLLLRVKKSFKKSKGAGFFRGDTSKYTNFPTFLNKIFNQIFSFPARWQKNFTRKHC